MTEIVAASSFDKAAVHVKPHDSPFRLSIEACGGGAAPGAERPDEAGPLSVGTEQPLVIVR